MAPDHTWIKSRRDLFSFVKYVLLYAPDHFPKEDFLSDDQQMTIERAFSEIHRGVGFLNPSESEAKQLTAFLETSLAMYQAGDVVRAGTLLNQFDLIAFRQEWSEVERADANRPQ